MKEQEEKKSSPEDKNSTEKSNKKFFKWQIIGDLVSYTDEDGKHYITSTSDNVQLMKKK